MEFMYRTLILILGLQLCCILCEVRLYNPFVVVVVRQANIRLIKAGLKLVGAMCSCGSDVASVLIVSC